MSAAEMKDNVLRYFASVSGHDSLSIRDFNAQLMSNIFDPGERETLAVALEELIQAGILVQRSPTQYAVTTAGRAVARATRSQGAPVPAK